MSRVPLKSDARKPQRDVRLREGQGSGAGRGDRRPPRYCETEGCRAATFLHKPHCAEHVESNPRAALLTKVDAAELAAHEIAEAKAERRRQPRKQRPSRAKGAKP